MTSTEFYYMCVDFPGPHNIWQVDSLLQAVYFFQKKIHDKVYLFNRNAATFKYNSIHTSLDFSSESFVQRCICLYGSKFGYTSSILTWKIKIKKN